MRDLQWFKIRTPQDIMNAIEYFSEKYDLKKHDIRQINGELFIALKDLSDDVIVRGLDYHNGVMHRTRRCE